MTLSKTSLLVQEVSTDSSDKKWVIKDSDNEELTGKFDDLGNTKLFNLLSIEAETYTWSQKSTKHIFKSDTHKQTNLLFEVFDYIYTAKY